MARIEPDSLEEFAQRLLEETGTPAETACRVASTMVSADIRGHVSHGVRLIPRYAQFTETGDIDPTATPSVERETLLSAVVEGHSA